MPVESIEIKNYRLFRSIELKALPSMVVVVGANGSGKSTLFDVFTFLKDALAENAAAAVARRGGFRELVSRDTQGPIEITIKFRESGGRLVTYQIAVGFEKGRVAVEREVLSYRIGRRGRPWRFVDFSRGVGKAITNESAYGEEGAAEERMDYALDDPSILAIKGLGQFREFPIVSELRSMIEHWYISDFHIADARPSVAAGYAEHLSPRGDNLAQVAWHLYENHPDRFDRVLKAMNWDVPGVTNVEVKATEDGRLVLRFQDGSFKDPFIARHVSDGTIKMFAYLVLLYDPKPHPLLILEGPENQLDPRLMLVLTEYFRAYSYRGGQVFLSTQSTDFLNGVKLGEVFNLVKKDGFSSVVRPEESETLRSLVNGGELPGRLWKQGLLEGVV